MSVRTIALGKVLVPGLPPDQDPSVLVGDLRCYAPCGLTRDYFTPRDTDVEPWRNRLGIEAWSTNPIERELQLINFKKTFRTFQEAYDRIRQEGYPTAGFPELCGIVHRKEELWWDEGVPYAVITDPNSFLRYVDNVPNVPFLQCDPYCSGLDALHVCSCLKGAYWFLVGAK